MTDPDPQTNPSTDSFSAPAATFVRSSPADQSASPTLICNDPVSPRAITANVEALPGHPQRGQLSVTGATHFGRVACGTRAQRTLSLHNCGGSGLFVSQVNLRHGHGRFRLISNPFPAILEPGASMKIVTEFHAVDGAARPCELVIHSADPDRPVMQLDLLAQPVCTAG